MKNILYALCLLTMFQISAQTGMSTEKWREDLRFLQQTVHEDYPFLFKKTTPEAFDSAVRKLDNAIPGMEDHEVVVGLSEIIALFKYGHTDISFSHGPFAFHYFPFNLYSYSDGIYIQGVHQDYREALGAKVVSVSGMPIADALDTIYPVVNAENHQYFRAYGINYLRLAEVLHARGLLPELSEKLILGLEKEGNSYEVSFTAMPGGERPPLHYGLIRQQGEWLEARDQSATPHYLKNLDRKYYFEYLPDARAVYVRYSQVLHEEGEDIPTFFNRVFDFIRDNDVDRLVLDVRLNGGGNNYFNKPVVRGIIQSAKIDQVAKFYVLLGKRTFSACQNLVLELDSYTNAIFVGEPTAENINFYGDNNRIALPNSGIPVYLSFAWWQDKPQWEDGPWLAPHIAVEMSYDEYSRNLDPVLETALNFEAADFVLDPMQYMTGLYMAGDMEKLTMETSRMIADPKYRFYDFEGEINKTGYRILTTGNTQEAIAVFGFGTRLFPNSAKTWAALAEAYFRSGQTEKATEHYKKALALDPKGPVGKSSKEKLAQIGGM